MIRIVAGCIPRSGVGYCRAEATIDGVRASVTVYSDDLSRRKYRLRTGQATRDMLLQCPAGAHLIEQLTLPHYLAMVEIADGAREDNVCAMQTLVEALYQTVNAVQLTALTA